MKWSVRWRLAVGISICLILFVLIEYMFMTETVQMKRGQQVVFEERSIRQPWKLQSFNSFLAEAERLNANQAIMIHRGFFGLLWTKYSYASGSMTTDDGQEVVTLAIP